MSAKPNNRQVFVRIEDLNSADALPYMEEKGYRIAMFWLHETGYPDRVYHAMANFTGLSALPSTCPGLNNSRFKVQALEWARAGRWCEARHLAFLQGAITAISDWCKEPNINSEKMLPVTNNGFGKYDLI